jgi:hypothetical protein
VGKKMGRLQLFLPESGGGLKLKIYLTSDDLNQFLILSYSFSISRPYRIPHNISPFLVPIIVGVGVNDNHFEYWFTIYLGYRQCSTSVLVPLPILHQKM